RGLLAASDLDATDDAGRLFTVSSAKEYVPPKPGDPVPERTSRLSKRTDDAPGEPIIQVENLTRTFTSGKTHLFKPAPEVHALRGISFEVPRGGRLGVVGESGSGKSTLLRILAGLDQPTSGSAVVVGNEVAGAKEHQLRELRQQLQIVFQDPMGSLNPRMTVEQIISEPLLVPGRNETAAQRSQMVADMLEAVGLPASAAKRYPHQFSGGQRQRISIARALICRPQV